MKKVKSILLMIAMSALFLTGCGKEPEETVEKFCESMKGLDFEKMSECMAEPGSMQDMKLDSDEDMSDTIMTYLTEESKEIKYKIRKTEVDGDDATVSVTFKYNDQSDIIKGAMGYYIQQGFAQAFSGENIDTDELFKESLDKAIEECKKKTDQKTVDIICEKIDKEWKIVELDDAMADVLLGNAYSAFSDIADSFNSGSSDTSSNDTNSSFTTERSQEAELDEDNYIDVAAGDVLELATLKIRINSCKELNELSDDYSSTTAREGTKFVQLEVTVENITKNPFACNIDAQIIDDQGRAYSEFSDAIMYTDNYITYRELSPNMPETGTITFNVPADSQNFYIPLAHAETNQVYHLQCQ